MKAANYVPNSHSLDGNNFYTNFFTHSITVQVFNPAAQLNVSSMGVFINFVMLLLTQNILKLNSTPVRDLTNYLRYTSMTPCISLS